MSKRQQPGIDVGEMVERGRAEPLVPESAKGRCTGMVAVKKGRDWMVVDTNGKPVPGKKVTIGAHAEVDIVDA